VKWRRIRKKEQTYEMNTSETPEIAFEIVRVLLKNVLREASQIMWTCSFVFNECRLPALPVASLRLLDRRSTWTGTRSNFLVKISSRFSSHPCRITWSIPMIIQDLFQLREGHYFEKRLPFVSRSIRTNGFRLHARFSRFNNEKNILTTFIIFLNWKVQKFCMLNNKNRYKNFTCLPTTPDDNAPIRYSTSFTILFRR